MRAAPRPWLVIVDLMMPVMDGSGFRAKQKADRKLAGVPVILLEQRQPGDQGDEQGERPHRPPVRWSEHRDEEGEPRGERADSRVGLHADAAAVPIDEAGDSQKPSNQRENPTGDRIRARGSGEDSIQERPGPGGSDDV
jgi:hypothetical protein